ncbi:M48 family metalloprotease [Sphingomonas sp. ID0503]|uniref:M48 family metalloprotease n=1 Tax=Sphingomonas sp. ID0503 TaxID=3399691 RepID=UPI003AFB7871
MIRKAAAFCVALSLAGAPALAQSSISASDKQQGAQAHPELLKEYGGPYKGPQAAYVERVGKRVATQSGLSNAQGDFTVTLLDSSVENAFAIPGGYVYVTRQLVALMNSEAELASVMGHEVGHVAARHSAKRNNRSQLGSILAAAAGALTGSDIVGQVAGYGAQLYTLGFSRSQEYAADGLGVRYITQAGYDPYAAADMLASLDAETSLQARIEGRDASATPGWASTHPNGVERVKRAEKLAQKTGRQPAPAVQDTAFLRMLDGMAYDDSPSQGIVSGQTFSHPELRLRFTAPAGYTIANSADAVSVSGSGGKAQFGMGSATADLGSYIDAAFAKLAGSSGQVSRGELRSFNANGIPAAYATARASSGGRVVDATIVAYRFPSATYQFLIVTPSGSGLGPFAGMVSGLTQLTGQQAAAIKGKRIRIVTVAAGDTIDSLARQMAYPNFQRERFMTLNALSDAAALRPGMLVKLVVE